MLISKQWLEQFTTMSKDITPDQLGEALTMRVVEVEEVIDEAVFLRGIVVGKIVEVSPHPNANALRLTKVDIGSDVLPVVCGGSNLEGGMLIAMGTIGAQVRWHGEGDRITLEKATIRGEVSMGMICAAEEIGLGEMFPKKDEKEILDLSDVATQKDIGMPLATVLKLDDVVFDIDNKSMTHRPDLWGHYGMAREVSAMYGGVLHAYAPAKIKTQDTTHKIHVSVQDTDACPRYMTVAMDGIVVQESPVWLKKRLMSVGVTPKNNVVDVTNYVMYELGQPMHAFDSEQITDTKQQITIHVRKARRGETFVSLDTKIYELHEEDLVIATDAGVIALAGVKGSNTSGVTEKTTSIILESATFDAVTVRRTATRHGLRTDASARFEKSLDPHMCELALRRAVELLKDLCSSATVSSTIVDQANVSLNQGPIELDTHFVRRKMGVDVPTKKMIQILASLGFTVKAKKDMLKVTVPTWRATKDISIREDLVEEIARVYGYDNIEPSLPTFPIEPPPRNELRELETKLRELLAYEAGYTEVSTYSFVSPERLENIGESLDDYIKLENPIAKDRPYLRRHLVGNMLEVVENNLHRFDTVRIFEIGTVFHVDKTGQDDGIGGVLPTQDTMLAVAYASKGDDVPFSEVSTSVAGVLARLGVSGRYEKKEDAYSFAHPGRSAMVMVEDVEVGNIAEVHPLIAETIGLDARTAILELNLSSLLSHVSENTTYTPLPQYPAVERDIAFVVPAGTVHAEIAAALIEADELTVDAELFDVYEGDKVDAGKKSMAYRITYRSDARTLTGEEVDVVHEKVAQVLQKRFGAEIR